MTDNVELYKNGYKQTCLHSFLSKRKALYSHQTIQRRKMQIFDCISCFSSQSQEFSYRYLQDISQIPMIADFNPLFCHYQSIKKNKTQSVSKLYKRQKAEEKSLFLPPKQSSYIEHHVRGYDVLL